MDDKVRKKKINERKNNIKTYSNDFRSNDYICTPPNK